MDPLLWLTKATPHLRARALWAALFALVALFASCAAPAPPPRTTEGVAAMLGAAVGGEVRPDDFVWEARGGFFADAFLGRRVLFLARKPGGSAELYRARVRLTRAGRPLRLADVHDLTKSPLGDEHDLVAQGHHAAYVTTAFGAVQGITLLDLDGEGEAREARGFWQRTAAAIESWLETGSTRGVGRTEITFGLPPAEAKHELQGDLLVMALGKEALPAAIDVRDGTLSTGAQNPAAAVAQRIPHRAPPFGDTLARATGVVIGEGAGRLAQAITGSIEAVRARFATAPVVDAKIEAGAAPPGGDTFPPAAIAPVIQPPLAGEGAWTAARAAGGRGEAGAPVFAYEAAIRPDPRVPEALVRLVALDTRQVDLRLAPGVEEPRSLTGLHGTGRPPEGVPAERLAAAFAGGPASRADEAGALGFAADRRVMAPPVPGLSTIALAEDGHAAMGPWPFGPELSPPFVSVRQTPDAIVGFAGAPKRPLAGANQAIERSALGLLPTGQLVYAWSARATAETLGRALTLAGCTQAAPLAAGPAPSGFAYLRANAPAEPLARGMSLDLASRARNDLFYVVLRNTAPPAPSGGAALAPDGGRQPAPTWIPAIHTGVVTNLGAQVHVTTFAPGRLAYRLRAGGKEPATKAVAALPGSLSDAETPKLLAAVGMGTGKRRGARGLVIDGAVGLPIRGEETGLLAIQQGRPRILKSTELTPAPGVDAAELPLTADDGKLLPAARDVGSMRSRAAACVLEDGTFVVATTTFDSDEAATTALLELGCSRVVALDRGSHRDAFLHRAGSANAPQPRYEATTLFAVEVPLSGRAGPLEPR